MAANRPKRSLELALCPTAYDPGCVKTQNLTPSVELISSFFELNAQSGNRISFCAQCRKLILTNLGERTFSHSLGHKRSSTPTPGASALVGRADGTGKNRTLGASVARIAWRATPEPESPVLGVKRTEFAARRTTAYSQKRTLGLLTPISAFRPDCVKTRFLICEP